MARQTTCASTSFQHTWNLQMASRPWQYAPSSMFLHADLTYIAAIYIIRGSFDRRPRHSTARAGLSMSSICAQKEYDVTNEMYAHAYGILFTRQDCHAPCYKCIDLSAKRKSRHDSQCNGMLMECYYFRDRCRNAEPLVYLDWFCVAEQYPCRFVLSLRVILRRIKYLHLDYYYE